MLYFPMSRWDSLCHMRFLRIIIECYIITKEDKAIQGKKLLRFEH